MTAYLQITLQIAQQNRGAAAEVYRKYRDPFLKEIAGAKSKELLVREEDVQVLHGFDAVEHAQAYLKSKLFNDDVVGLLKPLLQGPPDIRVYSAV